MPVNGKVLDMTETIVANYHANQLDCLVCLGGGGTMKNALRLQQAGLNVVTLPKTIDNDPHHRGRDHGPPRRLAGPGRGHQRRRRRDTDSGNSL
jgi:hypothetical protein